MTLQEKHAQVTKNKRQFAANIWLTNEAMNENDPENPVLVDVPAVQFERDGSYWKKQGYTKFTPSKPAPAPIEAKAAKVVKSENA